VAPKAGTRSSSGGLGYWFKRGQPAAFRLSGWSSFQSRYRMVGLVDLLCGWRSNSGLNVNIFECRFYSICDAMGGLQDVNDLRNRCLARTSDK
jgi:hypothetical protein